MKAFTLSSIADLQNSLKRPTEGLANYQRALAILEPLRAADPDDQFGPQAIAFMLNGRGESHLLLGDHAAALHDFSEAEKILRNGPPPQPTDMAEIRMLPGITHANLARVTAVIAQHAATPKNLRANYVREAGEWSRRARETLEPLTKDALEGRHARQVIDEMNAATAALPEDCRKSGSAPADCR
jgi:tetratricopeptide (TPR) repeat protein